MAHPSLTFGQIHTFGEIARAADPTDELEVQMARALGQPPDPYPPFAVVPVLLDGALIGNLEKIQFSWGGTLYNFRSSSGKTQIACTDRLEVLKRLEEVVGLASPQPGPPNANTDPNRC